MMDQLVGALGPSPEMRGVSEQYAHRHRDWLLLQEGGGLLLGQQNNSPQPKVGPQLRGSLPPYSNTGVNSSPVKAVRSEVTTEYDIQEVQPCLKGNPMKLWRLIAIMSQLQRRLCHLRVCLEGLELSFSRSKPPAGSKYLIGRCRGIVDSMLVLARTEAGTTELLSDSVPMPLLNIGRRSSDSPQTSVDLTSKSQLDHARVALDEFEATTMSFEESDEGEAVLQPLNSGLDQVDPSQSQWEGESQTGGSESTTKELRVESNTTQEL